MAGGDLTPELRAKYRWERVDGTLRYGGVTLDDRGVSSRLLGWRVFRRRFWPWSTVAYLTWSASQYNASLAVCARGDPYVHWIAAAPRTPRACRALVDDAKEFVEAHGARVRSAIDVAEMWWVDQPEAQRDKPQQ
jgi:hypothetical protein